MRAPVSDLEWQHTSFHLNARMVELGFDQSTLAQQAGVSTQTVRDLQRGLDKRYHPGTLASIAQALRWPLDAFPRLLTGLPPA